MQDLNVPHSYNMTDIRSYYSTEVLTELQKPGVPELYLSLSDDDKQEWVSEILD